MNRLIALFVLICALLASPVSAQTGAATAPPTGRVLITVVDMTGGVLPGAVVVVTGIEDATRSLPIAPLKASDKGLATLESVTLGRYSITAEFPGFEKGTVKELRVKAGDNKQVITLQLQQVTDSVTVAQDKQAKGADRATSFGSALTREQIEALSDDPVEMQRQLKEMAGQDATIRVDSFEGQDLPPKAQIKSIHITRDQFAAESHAAGGTFIDIITQPGVGPVRSSMNVGFSDGRFDGRNPLVQARGPAQNRSARATVGGALIKDKATFSTSFNGLDSFSTPVGVTSTTAGTEAANLNLRQPSQSKGASGLLDYAITRDQTLRLGVNLGRSSQSNMGVGDFNRASRAYASNNNNWSIRVQEAGPLGRRFFINTRFSINASNAESHSATEAMTVIVNDAFTDGGAQQRGGTHSKNFTLASDLDYVRGLNSWRAGVEVGGSRYRSDRIANYLGTYTFASNEDFDAGRPRSFTRRIGDPNIEYWNVQAGMYLQDDFRLRKNITISAGLRYEAQTHLSDYLNLGPRAGITWSPFKSGKTTLRASWGIFYDWLSTGTYQQTLQVDGFRQQEVNLANPTFPDPGALDAAPPVNRYLLQDDLQMAVNQRTSLGGSQSIGRRMSVSATFSYIRSNGLLVGQNLNVPASGIRPDPKFANVIETVGDASARSVSLSTNASFNLAALTAPGALPASAAAGKRFDWRRGLFLYTNYYLRRSENNTDGAFSVPATYDLSREWGPSAGETRHSGSISIGSNALKNLNASLNLNMNSAPPLTIRTGTDDNGDLIFNDRPAGVGRNSVRTIGQWSVSASLGYALGFGKRTVALPPGVMITASGGMMQVASLASQAAPRYRLSFSAYINNLTNHATFSGFSGIITSKFFLKPTSAYGVRNISFNATLGF